jgi:hypothetical protein
MVKRYKGKEKGRIHTEVRVDAKIKKGGKGDVLYIEISVS